MHTTTGLESLAQHGKTPFFNDLTILYKESFDEVRKLSSITAGGVLMTLKAINFRERIKNIMFSHMGIKLFRITINDSDEPNMAAWLALDYNALQKSLKERSDSSGTMMEKVNRLYNDRTGSYDHREGPMPFYLFSFTIYTGLWTLLNKDNSFYLEPEELAAITLHEVGHIDHYIRVSRRIYADTVDSSDIVNYITQTPDKEVILALLDNIKQSSNIDKSWLPIVKATEKYFKTSNALDNQEYYEALATLGVLVTAETADFSLMQLNTTIYSLGPVSRTVKTRLIDIDPERSADDFAVRNGCYQYLVSGILKLEKLATYNNSIFLRQFMATNPAIVVGYLKYFKSLLNINAEDIVNGYDPAIKRIELMIETAKHAFSDSNLSAEIKKDIHQQIAESEAYLKTYRSTNHQQIRSKLKQWKDTVGKLGRIVASPFQNRLSQDYERLQDSTRSLSRHSLFYLADKK